MRVKAYFRPSKFKLISLTLIALMLWQFAGGTVYAQTRPLEVEQQKARTAAIVSGGGSKRFDKLLSELKDTIKQGAIRTKSEPQKGFASIEKIESLKSSLAQENDKNEEYFNSLEDLIKDKNLGGEILRRQRQFVAEYRVKYKTLLADVGSIESASSRATGLLGKLTGSNQNVDYDGPVNQTIAFLEASAPKTPKPSFDPHNLPHRSLKADRPIAPKLTRAEWDRAFPKDPAATIETASTTNAAQSGSGKDRSSSRSHHARRQTTSATTFAGTSAPTAADLAETIEVKFTPEIKALADSLDKNPVKIYNWVRNNIEFTPTWGSIQGAELCMENRAGNAFDTSSLLIALLRYSGIPARYQMGTIEVPIEKFKNWAGGFTNAEAAASFFASGGVPSVVRRVNQSGQVVSVKLEHVWVEAYVDYAPSAASINNQADSWTELDAGFKQYSFSPAVDLSAFVNVGNPQQLLDSVFPAGSTTDDEVLSMDQTTLSQRLTPDDTGGLSFLLNTVPNLTPRQIAGGPTIVTNSRSILAATLPYHVLARASLVAAIPDTLRHRMTLEVVPSAGSSLTYSSWLPEIGASQIVIGYKAATPDDSAYMASLLPTDSATPYPEEFPMAAVRVKPLLKVNDAMVSEGASVPFTSVESYRIHFTAPTITTPDVINNILVGETQVVALDLQKPAPSLFAGIENRLAAQSARLSSGDWQQISFTEIGELTMNAIAATWFAEADMTADMVSNRFDVVTQRYPSAAVCFADLQPAVSLFGIPLSIRGVGFGMDIDRDIVVSESRQGDHSKLLKLQLLMGMFGSQLEATVPLQFMSTTSQPAKWIASTGVIGVALAKNIPVAEIDSTNLATLLPKLALQSQAIEDIQDAVNAGLFVLVHEQSLRDRASPILGYVALDKQTGSAVYIIQRLNGAEVLDSLKQDHPILANMITQVYGPVWDAARDAAKDRAMQYVLDKMGIGGLGDLITQVGNLKSALDKLQKFVEDTQNKIAFYNSELAAHGEQVKPLAGLLIIVGALEVVSQAVKNDAIGRWATVTATIAMRGYENLMLHQIRTDALIEGGIDPLDLGTP